MTTIADRTASIASLAAAACERTATYEVLNTATTAAWAAVEAAKQAYRDAEAAALAAEGARSDAEIERDTSAIAALAWELAEGHVDDARRCGYQALPSDATDCFEAAQLERDLRHLGIADDDGELVRMLGAAIAELLAIDAGYAAEEAAYHAAERAADDAARAAEVAL